MEYKRKKLVILLFLALTFVVFIAFGHGYSLSSQTVEAISVKTESLKEEYVLDSVLTIPSDVRVEVNGQEIIPSDTIVYYPDRKAYKKDSYVLSELGKYEIVFFAEYDGKKIEDSYFFTVVQSEEDAIDTISPSIKVSLTEDLNNPITQATVAVDEPIYIPENIQVSDVNYFGVLKKNIYFDKGGRNESNVFIDNGTFTPTREGRYTLVYTAVDAYGNQGSAEVVYFAVSGEALTYEQPNVLQALVSGRDQELPLIESVNSICGDVTVSVCVLSPLGEVVNDGYVFTPKVLGEYKVEYHFKTLVYDTVFTYQVSCNDSEDAVFFNDDFVLPRYFIKDATYQLEPYTVYLPIDKGFKAVDAEIWVKADDGDYTKINDINEYKAEANEKLRFKFVCKGKYVESKEISVVDVGYGAQEIEYLDYFVGDYTAKEKGRDGFSFTFDYQEKEELTLEFINLISFDNFALQFSIPENYANFKEMHVILSDYSNPEIKNTIRYSKIANGFTFKVLEGNTKQNTVTSMTLDGLKDFLQCDNGTKIVNNLKCVQNCMPIESDKCYMTIKFIGVSGNCRLDINKLNLQSLSDTLWESTPDLANKRYGVRYLGDTLKILPMEFTSVFNPTRSTDAKVSVTFPDGSYATTTDGKVLNGLTANQEYTVKVTEAGMWSVQYVVSNATSDGSGRFSAVDYVVNVLDTTAPTITFADGITNASVVEVSKNELYTIVDYTITDNLTSDKEIKSLVYVIDEKNHLYIWDKTELVFQEVGRYTIIVYAVDGDGNTAQASYTVVVK